MSRVGRLSAEEDEWVKKITLRHRFEEFVGLKVHLFMPLRQILRKIFSSERLFLWEKGENSKKTTNLREMCYGSR